MNQKEMESIFGEPIYTYTAEQAVEDGILMPNPRRNRFSECNLITTHLFERIEEAVKKRNETRIFGMEAVELVGCLMLAAAQQYNTGAFKGDNDKDFFVVEAGYDGFAVWFVRNEHGKLTAMLPSDY